MSELRSVLPYVRPYSAGILAGLGLIVVSNAFGILVPWLIGLAIDSLERVRQVAIEDLLRREPVSLDEVAIAQTVRDNVVLVSGAGGSIGSELCRQIARYSPSRLLLVERSENALFEIHRELASSFPGVRLVMSTNRFGYRRAETADIRRPPVTRR